MIPGTSPAFSLMNPCSHLVPPASLIHGWHTRCFLFTKGQLQPELQKCLSEGKAIAESHLKLLFLVQGKMRMKFSWWLCSTLRSVCQHSTQLSRMLPRTYRRMLSVSLVYCGILYKAPCSSLCLMPLCSAPSTGPILLPQLLPTPCTGSSSS